MVAAQTGSVHLFLIDRKKAMDVWSIYSSWPNDNPRYARAKTPLRTHESG